MEGSLEWARTEAKRYHSPSCLSMFISTSGW